MLGAPLGACGSVCPAPCLPPPRAFCQSLCLGADRGPCPARVRPSGALPPSRCAGGRGSGDGRPSPARTPVQGRLITPLCPAASPGKPGVGWGACGPVTGRGPHRHPGPQASALAAWRQAAGAGCLQLESCGARPGPHPRPAARRPSLLRGMALQRAILLAGLLVEVASKSSDSSGVSGPAPPGGPAAPGAEGSGN